MRRTTYRLLLSLLTGCFLASVGVATVYLGYPAWRDTPALQALAAEPASVGSLHAVAVSPADIERAPWQAGLRLHGSLLFSTIRKQEAQTVQLSGGWRLPPELRALRLNEPLRAAHGFDLDTACEGGAPVQQLAWLQWKRPDAAKAWAQQGGQTPHTALEGQGLMQVVLRAEGEERATWLREGRPWWVPSRLDVAQGQDAEPELTKQLTGWKIACADRPSAVSLGSLTMNRWDRMPSAGFQPVRAELQGKQVTLLEGHSALARVKGASGWKLVRTTEGGTALRWQFDELDSARTSWEQLRRDLVVAGTPSKAIWRKQGADWELRDVRWSASGSPGAEVHLQLVPAAGRWLVEVVWTSTLVEAVSQAHR